MDARLPAGLEVSALLRAVEAAGGFATILAKGEPDSGAVLLVLQDRGGQRRIAERVPEASGERRWRIAPREESESYQEFNDYLARRRKQDPDLWIVELDIPQAERFVG